MKSWQVILTGLLPYFISYFSLFGFVNVKYGISWNGDALFFSWPVLFFVIIPYSFIILPWYYVQYIMLHHYNKRTFYYGTLVICIFQPIIVSIFLKVRIGSPEFFLVVSPILIVGIFTSMICIRIFYQPDIEKDETK